MLNWPQLDDLKHQDEAQAASCLMSVIDLTPEERSVIDTNAVDIVRAARLQTKRKGLMETFLEEFGLSNNEGLALMCLAESLLRVPDTDTADKLIAEKVSSGKWADHKGQSDSWLVNASTWGLMLTGKIVDVGSMAHRDVNRFMQNLTRKTGAPVIRAAVMQAMRIMGEQFVVGRTINEAIRRSEKPGMGQTASLCSFDMLGEGARTMADARRYFQAYFNAIQALSAASRNSKKQVHDPETTHGISVKLSALHPRFDALHEDLILSEMYPKLLELAQAAAKSNINFCLDAEEADKLILSLKLLEMLAEEPSLGDWSGLGLAVQSYQKRSLSVIDKLTELSKQSNRRLMVRLVKGAYWDSEIKHSQIEGHPDYPVWTRKSTTDLCYLACARKLFNAGETIYPQFATHNAHSVAAIQHMAGSNKAFEFQRLHGMGDSLYRAADLKRPVRIYAPVGAHKDLLPYLVRRLLENGANTSFVHSFLDDDVLPEDVARSPFANEPLIPHPKIPRPVDMFGSERPNSKGLDITQEEVRRRIEEKMIKFKPLRAHPLINGASTRGQSQQVFSPAAASPIGDLQIASSADVDAAFISAKQGFVGWNARGGKARGAVLRAMGDALEAHMEEFVAIMGHEAGKTFADSIAEVREAVDFCRYYAAQAEAHFEQAHTLPGPAGEINSLTLAGRGVFVCISPWNFPLAIFAGQITAALAAGNTVIAKPAEQTPLTALMAVKLFIEAGLPADVLQFLPGNGEDIGAALTAHPDVAGVCFTGSTQVAKIINRTLAAKDGPIPVLIAETGGLNGMFVDTSALREQVIDDVVSSAFNAAGQRCSALRILFLPDESYDMIIEGIEGAMDCLLIGDPGQASTDIGPVIDAAALGSLRDYVSHLPKTMSLRKQCLVPRACDEGHYMPPTLIEADNLNDFNHEMFGPVLHVVRYKSRDLDSLMQEFAAKNYGLTLGIHSRLESFAKHVINAVPAGNIYINRNIIGAVVGVQPFGGHGLSGTGPKAGGPHYVARFATEVTVTNNISAQGGDPALLNLEP